MSRSHDHGVAVASLAAILLVAGPAHALGRPGPAVQPSVGHAVAAGPGCVLPGRASSTRARTDRPGGPMRRLLDRRQARPRPNGRVDGRANDRCPGRPESRGSRQDETRPDERESDGSEARVAHPGRPDPAEPGPDARGVDPAGGAEQRPGRHARTTSGSSRCRSRSWCTSCAPRCSCCSGPSSSTRGCVGVGPPGTVGPDGWSRPRGSSRRSRASGWRRSPTSRRPTATLLEVFRWVFGSLMVASLVLGVVFIRRGDVVTHSAWMTRGYAIGQGAGTQARDLRAVDAGARRAGRDRARAAHGRGVGDQPGGGGVDHPPSAGRRPGGTPRACSWRPDGARPPRCRRRPLSSPGPGRRRETQ